MSRVDWMIKQMRLLDIEGRTILDGARDESDLTKSIFASPESGSAVQLVPNRLPFRAHREHFIPGTWLTLSGICRGEANAVAGVSQDGREAAFYRSLA
jgi:hypothetical protein